MKAQNDGSKTHGLFFMEIRGEYDHTHRTDPHLDPMSANQDIQKSTAPRHPHHATKTLSPHPICCSHSLQSVVQSNVPFSLFLDKVCQTCVQQYGAHCPIQIWNLCIQIVAQSCVSMPSARCFVNYISITMSSLAHAYIFVLIRNILRSIFLVYLLSGLFLCALHLSFLSICSVPFPSTRFVFVIKHLVSGYDLCLTVSHDQHS
jgi:hypothetical protein